MVLLSSKSMGKIEQMFPSLVTMPSRLTSCCLQHLEYNNNNKIHIIHIHTIYIHMIHMKKQSSEYTWFMYTLWQSPSEAKWYDAHIFSSCKLKVACMSQFLLTIFKVRQFGLCRLCTIFKHTFIVEIIQIILNMCRGVGMGNWEEAGWKHGWRVTSQRLL